MNRRSGYQLRDNGTYPRFGPFGTRNGATIPTSPQSVVKQIIGSASEWETIVSTVG